MLGAALLDRFVGRWTTTELVHRHRIKLVGVDNVSADLSVRSELGQIVQDTQPNLVVHAAAWTDVDACESDPALARTLHRDATRALAEAAARVGAVFVYVSTDAVFSDGSVPHCESDAIHPLSVYAKTKREGEEAVLASCNRGLVLRTCIFGWSPGSSKLSLAEWSLRELRAGRSVKAFRDVWFSPISTTAFASFSTACWSVRRVGFCILAAVSASPSTRLRSSWPTSSSCRESLS